MRDYLTLGPVPCEEPCQQVGTEGYDLQMVSAECRRYLHQLVLRFPLPDGVLAYFTVKSFPHDFGIYREVCVVYDDKDEAAAEYAYFVEAHLPASWDDIDVLTMPVKEISRGDM